MCLCLPGDKSSIGNFQFYSWKSDNKMISTTEKKDGLFINDPLECETAELKKNAHSLYCSSQVCSMSKEKYILVSAKFHIVYDRCRSQWLETGKNRPKWEQGILIVCILLKTELSFHPGNW